MYTMTEKENSLLYFEMVIQVHKLVIFSCLFLIHFTDADILHIAGQLIKIAQS